MPFKLKQQKQFVILIATYNETNSSLLGLQLEDSWHYMILMKEQTESSILIKTIQLAWIGR
ncbi:MAG: hypothetical protein PHY16_09110 [Methylobacter sp.]|nr:hypothetical protein [Methylobacter sp.]